MFVIGVDIYVLFLNDHAVKFCYCHHGRNRVSRFLLCPRKFAVCFQHFGEAVDRDFMTLSMSRSEVTHSYRYLTVFQKL